MSSDDVDGWVGKFARFPIVQLIDLDAARGEGSNRAMVRAICARLPCQVGGGIRSPDDARAMLDAGARRVIVGSALFTADGVDAAAAARFSEVAGADRLIAAVDTRGGRIAVRGWKTMLDLTATEAIARLDPFVGAFLATLVDGEGRMGGLDVAAALTLRRATTRPLIVAGGVRSLEEVRELDRLKMDAVVGMAIYTGVMTLDEELL